jgi:hypothetical protein
MLLKLTLGIKNNFALKMISSKSRSHELGKSFLMRPRQIGRAKIDWIQNFLFLHSSEVFQLKYLVFKYNLLKN